MSSFLLSKRGDSQSTESVLVRLKVVDFLYSLMRTGLTSIKLWSESPRNSQSCIDIGTDHSALSIIMEYSIKPKRLGERRIIHYPQMRIIGLYVKRYDTK